MIECLQREVRNLSAELTDATALRGDEARALCEAQKAARRAEAQRDELQVKLYIKSDIFCNLQQALNAAERDVEAQELKAQRAEAEIVSVSGGNLKI